MPDNNIPNMTPEEMARAIQNFVFPPVPCGRCAHKEVCKLTEENLERCDHFLGACDPKTYGNIHVMFQPIFDWMRIHYPSGEIRFVVEDNKVQLWQEHKLCVYSKELTEIVDRVTQKGGAD